MVTTTFQLRALRNSFANRLPLKAAAFLFFLLVACAAVAAKTTQVPADCSGDSVTLQDQLFDGIRITCSATAFLSATSDVTLVNQSQVSMLAPTVSLGSGFAVAAGSVLLVQPIEIVTPPAISINSTSQNSTGLGINPPVLGPVPQQPPGGTDSYQILAVNDLGMHCGDLDTRVMSILPPFNVLHAQVLRKGKEPDLLGPGDGIEVVYSAASNDTDPILSSPNGTPQLAPDGSVYKTNFWEIARDAYAPFYPPAVLGLFYPGTLEIQDLGLPMPDVESFFLGADGQPGTGDEEALALDQQAMPSATLFSTSGAALPAHQPVTLATGPYVANQPQPFAQFVDSLPFFVGDLDPVTPGVQGFPFGYTARVNWFAADGLAIAAFDDFGRENPYPLMRVQARDTASDAVLASVDTVVPISSEADCKGCHAAPVDGGNGVATEKLVDASIELATSIDDPQEGGVPIPVSVEYASDLNILRLHDLKHGSGHAGGAKYTPDLVDQQPVVCQRCHYTPALDLAQVGPKGALDADGNGREQSVNKSMSNVMHLHHGQFADLFPPMPPPNDPKRTAGVAVNDFEHDILSRTCYRCHPGDRTQCLRGAMYNAGILCQDCHGNMLQVGDDFTRNKPAGEFELAADFYTNAATPRVPWANEPGCGSCHTGDVLDNLAADPSTIASSDGVRLIQAYRLGDSKATPIVPANTRFAENRVGSGPASGNPKLYRLSTGHGGLMCEACHGSTHAEWPNANPFANDNVTAQQLQGHKGTIIECETCHEGDLGNTLEGPHGMHPVGDTQFLDDHKKLMKDNKDACRACHGVDGEGSVLSLAATDRVLKKKDRGTVTLRRGDRVTCSLCHENKL